MRKKQPDPNTLVERAIAAAVPNVRSGGWRNTQMKVFAMRYGYWEPTWNNAQLEIECVRIIRSAGQKHARRLLNWFVSVKTDVDHASYPRFFPVQRALEGFAA